jgi:CPA1 family monovalent cation:H+ antiporter
VVIATIADRLRIAYPILLVIAGVVIALLPVQHRIVLQPDWVLLVFLPPLIYDAYLDTSTRELRTHWRPILLVAVGLVVATMVTVAVVVHSLVGGWAGGWPSLSVPSCRRPTRWPPPRSPASWACRGGW